LKTTCAARSYAAAAPSALSRGWCTTERCSNSRCCKITPGRAEFKVGNFTLQYESGDTFRLRIAFFWMCLHLGHMRFLLLFSLHPGTNTQWLSFDETQLHCSTFEQLAWLPRASKLCQTDASIQQLPKVCPSLHSLAPAFCLMNAAIKASISHLYTAPVHVAHQLRLLSESIEPFVKRSCTQATVSTQKCLECSLPESKRTSEIELDPAR